MAWTGCSVVDALVFSVGREAHSRSLVRGEALVSPTWSLSMVGGGHLFVVVVVAFVKDDGFLAS